jgi:integrase
MRRELTDALIRTLRAPEGGRLEIWDTRCEGLALRVAQTGRVTFHARARGPDGRKRFAGIGTWPTVSLTAARTAARVTVGQMQRGADPVAEKRAARAELERAASMPTLHELGEAWESAHARDTSARYRAELLASIRRACTAPAARGAIGRSPLDLLARKIDSIRTDDIAAVIQSARGRGDAEARHLVRALRRLLSFACAVGHIQLSPMDEWLRREKGGRRSIPWMRDGIRERVLRDDELRRLWIQSDSLETTARVFTRLMLLTACRTGELAGLTWRDVVTEVDDFGTQRVVAIQLPANRTKNRRAHRVPLGVLAGAELAALVGESSAPTERLVFPGISTRTAGICRSLRKAAVVPNWSWHDCRRTAATGMARLGCPREHVEAALNHISARGGLVGIYQRHTYDTEAEVALLQWQRHMAALVAGDRVADGVSLRPVAEVS